MSSFEYFKEFITVRLTAAAEEIFGAFKDIIVEYEEEIDRQRSLLDVVRKHEIKLHRTELPQQLTFMVEKVLVGERLCNQTRNSSIDKKDPETPQMREKQEEHCMNQEQELVLKHEADAFIMIPTYDENGHKDDQSLYLNPSETLNAEQKESLVKMPVISSVVGALHSDQQLISHLTHVVTSRYQKGGFHTKKNGDVRPHVCGTCSKSFALSKGLEVHMRIHTGERPYSCKFCGKKFAQTGHLTVHMRTHTGERPYMCNTCGKKFKTNRELRDHTRIHTGEKPFICKTCGKGFRQNSQLRVHLRKTHKGETPNLT